MGKRRRIQAVNGEIHLPESIIQHIQSFLSGKQAAQTSILSKSWHSAWLTRPNLDFDQRDFHFAQKSQIFDELAKFAKKTMRRYRKSNLKIESFRLRMERNNDIDDAKLQTLFKRLIKKAMRIGATDLNVELKYFENKGFVLPHRVLGSETLTRLSLTGCKIDLGTDRKVSCSRLKSLILHDVCIEGNTIWGIISSCPLIEELSLSECNCVVKIESSDVVTTRTSTRILALGSSVEFGKQNEGMLVVDGPINPYEFRELKCLFLGQVEIDALFFRDLSSKFPCLKDLTVWYCFGHKGIKISSCSLECISFKQRRGLCAKFDVPSIRKFKFSGSSLPSLTFKTASREWESDISLTSRRPSTSWFLRLKKLLTKLSLSRISLSLNIGSILGNSFGSAGHVQGLPKPALENLTLRVPYSVCSAVLECLFWSCRPKFITQYWLPEPCYGWRANNDFLEVLCRALKHQVCQNCCISDQSVFGECDLKEVNVEYPEGTLTELLSLRLPLKTLFDASASGKDKRKIRFQLRWGPEPSTFK